MSIDKRALIGFIAEIEASRDRARGETRHQSEIFKKAREKGLEPKAMRKVLQRRAMSATDRESIDEAVDLYEHALGALQLAVEAVQGGMSAREAAERYDVPRGALGSLVTGAKNAISAPQESCGGVESRHAVSGQHGEAATTEAGPIIEAGPMAKATADSAPAAGVAPGPQDLTQAVDRAFFKSVEIEDDLTIPPMLRGPAPENKRMG